MAFPKDYAFAGVLLERLCVVYIIAVLLRGVNALLNVIYEILESKSIQKNTPLKGLIQVIQIIVIFIGVIIIIAVIVNKSPVSLFAGLGASAAILSFVFKDSLVGLVSGIQLSANDMLRPGDWISLPKHNVDGDVIEVGLNAVKVRNFDNTISTIPPSTLMNDSFQNWRGMSESGGRRIKRSIFIDMTSVRFCSPEMLEKFRNIGLITEYIDQKEEELHKYNEEHHINASVLVNGRRQTNLGIFRAYIEQYLRNNPFVNQNLTCMVRHLQPTEKGIPMELYFFSAEKRWVPYEGIMADVFDHILASVQEFDLRIFQNISGADILALRNN